jgi:hypothetical protein
MVGPPHTKEPDMQTTLMTPDALNTLNIQIGRKLDAARPGSDESRQLLRQRRTVRTELERRRAAASN